MEMDVMVGRDEGEGEGEGEVGRGHTNCGISVPLTSPVFLTVAVTVYRTSYKWRFPPPDPPAGSFGCGDPS